VYTERICEGSKAKEEKAEIEDLKEGWYYFHLSGRDLHCLFARPPVDIRVALLVLDGTDVDMVFLRDL
jgi:hypothetical protein